MYFPIYTSIYDLTIKRKLDVFININKNKVNNDSI